MSEEVKHPNPPQGGDATIPISSNPLRASLQPVSYSGEWEPNEAAMKLLERYAGPPPSIEVTYMFADGLKYRGILYRVEEKQEKAE